MPFFFYGFHTTVSRTFVPLFAHAFLFWVPRVRQGLGRGFWFRIPLFFFFSFLRTKRSSFHGVSLRGRSGRRNCPRSSQKCGLGAPRVKAGGVHHRPLGRIRRQAGVRLRLGQAGSSTNRNRHGSSPRHLLKIWYEQGRARRNDRCSA